MPATARRKCQSGAPKRSPSSSAIGRAPIATMSRRIPPTPVAAPWNGSTARRVVVRLDLERDRDAVAEVDHAGVLARPLQHALAARRQPAQQRRRVLVAAVLRPEQREDRELEVVRRPPEQLPDTVELPVGETESAVERLVGDGSQRAMDIRPLGWPPWSSSRSGRSGAAGWRSPAGSSSAGADATYDGAATKELALVTLVVAEPDPEDELIASLADPDWLAWMKRNFTEPDDVPELGDARSYATAPPRLRGPRPGRVGDRAAARAIPRRGRRRSRPSSRSRTRATSRASRCSTSGAPAARSSSSSTRTRSTSARRRTATSSSLRGCSTRSPLRWRCPSGRS